MRIKVNSLNLGLVYETCIICSEFNEEYFKETIRNLEKNHAVRTYLFVYDRDPLTKKVQRIIKQCYSNIFMLTKGVAEAAARGENEQFYQVYAFTQAHNPHSISLSQVDNTTTDYSIKFPPEMESFTWLHRKDFCTGAFTPKAFAEKLCKEIRLNFSNREQKRFHKFSSLPMYELYDSYLKTLIAAGIVLLSPLILYLSELLLSLGNIETTEKWVGLLCQLGVIVSYVLMAAAMIVMCAGPSFLIVGRVVNFDRTNNVSTTFLNFRNRTVLRIAIIAFIGIALITTALYTLWEGLFSEQTLPNESTATYLAYIPIEAFNLAQFTDVLLLFILANKAPHRLSFTRQRRIYNFTVCIAVYLTMLIASALYLTNML